MTIVEHVTREDVEARRAAILEEFRVTREELNRRYEDGELVGPEWMAWDEVNRLSWLIDE